MHAYKINPNVELISCASSDEYQTPTYPKCQGREPGHWQYQSYQVLHIICTSQLQKYKGNVYLHAHFHHRVIGYIEHSSSLSALDIFTGILILGVITTYMVQFWVIANNFRAFNNIVLSVPLNLFANALDNSAEIILQWFIHH